METDPGWTVGPNSATGGIWERADPVGVIAYRQGEAHVLQPFARLPVWLFYSNDLGPGYPGEDLFDIDMSTNGGGTWINLVSRLANTNDVFERLSFDLHDRVLLTSSMRFRFIARDLGGSSLVEAAVDDFMIEVLPPMPAGIEPGASPARRAVWNGREAGGRDAAGREAAEREAASKARTGSRGGPRCRRGS